MWKTVFKTFEKYGLSSTNFTWSILKYFVPFRTVMHIIAFNYFCNGPIEDVWQGPNHASDCYCFILLQNKFKKKKKKNESIHLQLKLHLNHFKSMFYFYTPEKVREYRIGTLPENGFAIISEQEFQFSQKFG